MSNVLDKSCRENQNTHFVFSNVLPENRVVYKMMWKNIKPEKSQVTTSYGTCWISKTIDTHSRTHAQNMKCLLFFPLQQLLRYTIRPLSFISGLHRTAKRSKILNGELERNYKGNR